MTWVFWVGLIFVSYTYLGYPAWLWLRSRRRNLASRRAEIFPSVSILIVARDEAQRLEQKLRNLMSLNYPQERTEIVVVLDGSNDGADEMLLPWRNSKRVLVHSSPVPRGKAAGLNDGLALAGGDIVLFTDVRQDLEPDCLRLLIENFADPEVGCVSGELMLGDPDAGEVHRGVGLYWGIEKKIRELESLSGSVVGATGAIYAIRRNLVVEIPSGTVLDDVYIPMQVVRQGKRVLFDSRARAWDVPDHGTGKEFARKVRTLGGNYQLLQLMPWLLGGENPVRFEFVSHKLLRLFVPFAVLAIFVSSAVLPGVIYRIALLLQILFYALSLLALTQLKLGRVARLADAAFTFVLLNTAAAVAFLRFISGRKVVWGR